MRLISKVCVFCGSSPGAHAEYAQAAADLGALLAAQDIAVVYGGGSRGLMGMLAKSAIGANGTVIGVMPEAMRDREMEAEFVTELRVVRTMHERKAQMEELSDAFLVLPGGIGTLEEVAEMFTWQQLGLHSKPIVLINIRGFFDPLLSQLDRMTAEGFLKQENRLGIGVATMLPDALDLLRTMAVPEGYPFLWRTDT